MTDMDKLLLLGAALVLVWLIYKQIEFNKK